MSGKTTQPIQLLLARPGFGSMLATELSTVHHRSGDLHGDAAVALGDTKEAPPLKSLIFARQSLPNAHKIQGDLDRDILSAVLKRVDVMAKRPNRAHLPWTLHCYAQDDDDATASALKLEKSILKSIKQYHGKFSNRYVKPNDCFDPEKLPAKALDSLLVLQIYFESPEVVWFSAATVGQGVSPHVAGNQRFKDRKSAPSRSARKLEEALSLMERAPKPGDLAIDLGAAPGGWSYVLARLGAHVVAIDHGALDIKGQASLKGKIVHLKDNGLTFRLSKDWGKHPEMIQLGREVARKSAADWLVCDMLVGSKETLRILREWMAEDAMNNFVVNVKLPQSNPWPAVFEAHQLLENSGWKHVAIKHLYHDRREVTLMGSK